MKYYQDKNKIYFQNLLKQDTFENIFQKHDNCLMIIMNYNESNNISSRFLFLLILLVSNKNMSYRM